MTDKEYVVYDFKKAGAVDDAANAFKIWVTKSSQVLSDYWSRLTDSPIKLQANEIRTQSFEAAIEQATSTSVGCIMKLDDGRVNSLCHLASNEIGFLISELLGYPEDFEAPDRAQTPIELSLCELFLEYFSRSLGEGWPGDNTLDCQLESLEVNPKRMRLFRAKDLVTVTSITIGLERGELVLHWILQKQETTELLESFNDRRSGQKSQNNPRQIVDRLPIEVVAVLGESQVSMRRLTELTEGDIVVLDQKIDRPIRATIDGKTFYECWPGRVGNRQGLEITTCF